MVENRRVGPTGRLSADLSFHLVLEAEIMS